MILARTPVQNPPRELFPLLNMVVRFLHSGRTDAFQFAKRYCNLRQTRFGWDFSGSSNLPELHERMKQVFATDERPSLEKNFRGNVRLISFLNRARRIAGNMTTRAEY